MSAKRHVYKITLWVKSPFLFRGLAGGAFGLDAAALRDESGAPIIPSDQIRGVIRDMLQRFSGVGFGPGATEQIKIFGRLSDEEAGTPASNDPIRSRIGFTDLTATKWSPEPNARQVIEMDIGVGRETTRVKIDDDLGAAETGMLQVIELAVPFGGAAKFEGEIAVTDAAERAADWATWLDRAVKALSAIGGLKSPGYGEVLAGLSSVVLVQPRTSARTAAIPADGRCRLRVTFDRPILFDARRIADNAFQGSVVVPGSAFKAALATALEFSGEKPSEGRLGATLAGLSFSHAFSESAEIGLPGNLPLPLSLVAASFEDRTVFLDSLRRPGGIVVTAPDKTKAPHAALFATDWKPGVAERAAALLGRPVCDEPSPLPRTHTKIDAGGTAADEQLFTTIALSVRRSDGLPRHWLIDVDLGRVAAEQRKAAEDLVTLLLRDGLHNLGKTGASATFEMVEDARFAAAKPIVGTGDRYAVMLTTPALMLDPATLVGPQGWLRSAEEAYGTYWNGLGVKMHGFFAEQTYRGGYQSRRRRLYGADVYHPFLLTQPGAVFEIECADPRKVADWVRWGLPALGPAGGQPLTWRNCPFVPENGFGRVTADHLSGGRAAELLAGGVDVKH